MIAIGEGEGEGGEDNAHKISQPSPDRWGKTSHKAKQKSLAAITTHSRRPSPVISKVIPPGIPDYKSNYRGYSCNPTKIIGFPGPILEQEVQRVQPSWKSCPFPRGGLSGLSDNECRGIQDICAGVSVHGKTEGCM